MANKRNISLDFVNDIPFEKTLDLIKQKSNKESYEDFNFDKGDFYYELLKNKTKETLSEQQEKELVFSLDKIRLYHYKSNTKKTNSTPLLVVYSMINKEYIMDLQPDRSFIKRLIDGGLDVYLIDWGYPTFNDQFVSLEDCINVYIGGCVDYIISNSSVDKINLLGVCQGGILSSIYISIHQDKIKNFVAMITPIDFDTKDALYFSWCKRINLQSLINSHGLIPGDTLNVMFLCMNPFVINVNKYRDLLLTKYKTELPLFLRMEHWTFDCPDGSGQVYLEYMDKLLVKDLLKKGEFCLGATKIDLHNIKCPILCLCGKKDNITPISTTKPLCDLVGSKDKEFAVFDCGHIGIYVSGSSQKTVAPKVIEWLNNRK